MRDLINIILEATYPDTDYGYWISQYGEVYPVGDHGHEPFIRAVENCNSAEAMMDGWVRVVVGPTVFQAEACFPKLRARTKSALMGLARDRDYSSFIVDNHDGTGEYTVNQFKMRHDFVRGVDSLIRNTPLNESVTPEVIDDDGDVEHAKYATFDEDGEAYIRFWATREGEIVIQSMHSSPTVRGRDMLIWLNDTYKLPIAVVEATFEADGFWARMEREGLVHSVDAADGMPSPKEAKSAPLDKVLDGSAIRYDELDEAARTTRPPLPGPGQTPWWVEALAPLTRELYAEWSAYDWSWTAGGCFAFADRLQKAYGGQLWGVSRHMAYEEGGRKYWNTDHAVVLINGHYYDYNGVFDPAAYIAKLAAEDATKGEGPFDREMRPKRSAGWFDDEFLDDNQWAGLLRVLKTGQPYA